MVRVGLAAFAKAGGWTPEKLLARSVEAKRAEVERAETKVKQLQGTIQNLRHKVKVRESRMVRERMLPDGDTLQKVARYEAHLSRQFFQALHELQRLQAARNGDQVPPPAALDVTVEAGGSNGLCLEAAG
jgi:hypothetical protein